jgi:hypothetical protein
LIYETDVLSVVVPMQVNQLPYNTWLKTYKVFVFVGVFIGLVLLLLWDNRKKIYNFIVIK